MARGGMYDQLGGGFARYSVDVSWTVPHFEKMLYDNALLLRVYAHWWRATGSPLARRVVTETADWMLRELRTADGGFASALDADSEGREGAFYAWTPADARARPRARRRRLGGGGARASPRAGTFEHGTSVLQLPRDPGADEAERFADVRARLLAAREQRPRPGRDDKVVSGWNGLAVAALAEAGALLDRPDWVEAASATAHLLVDGTCATPRPRTRPGLRRRDRDDGARRRRRRPARAHVARRRRGRLGRRAGGLRATSPRGCSRWGR